MKATHLDVVTLDLTFRVAVPLEAAIGEAELLALLRGDRDRTALLPVQKAQQVCDEVDRQLSAAWFTDGRKFLGVDIRIAGVEEREVAP